MLEESKMAREKSIKEWGDILLGKEIIKTEIETMDPLIFNEGYYSRNHSDRILKQKINKMLGDETSVHKRKEIIRYIALETTPPNGQSWANPNKEYICLENGHFNLNTMQLEEASPDNFITFKLPINYDPKAAKENLPKWETFLHELLNIESDILKLQEHFGNIFANHYETKRLLLFHGPQDSGKSTLIKIIQMVIGRDNYSSLSLHQLGEKFTNAELFRKIANFCAEISYGKEIGNYAQIKTLTGGDNINAQQKYKNPFDFVNRAKLFFASNGIPLINYDYADDAFYRRWDFIKFPNQFQPDNTILTKYTTPEMQSAIFLWMVQGYNRLKKKNWILTGELSIDDIKAIFADAGEKSIVDQWLTDNFEAGNQYYPKESLYHSYESYSKEHKEMPLEYVQFCKHMLNQNYIRIEKHSPLVEGVQVQSFKGLQVKKSPIHIVSQ